MTIPTDWAKWGISESEESRIRETTGVERRRTIAVGQAMPDVHRTVRGLIETRPAVEWIADAGGSAACRRGRCRWVAVVRSSMELAHLVAGDHWRELFVGLSYIVWRGARRLTEHGFKFSLRGMLIGVAVVALLLSTVGRWLLDASRQQWAVHAVRTHGGDVDDYVESDERTHVALMDGIRSIRADC